MMELWQDIGLRNIIFIRFNPDSYKKDGLTIGGCFEKDALGVIKPIKDEWNRRAKILKDTVDYYTKNIPEPSCTTIQLFYNGYSS